METASSASSSGGSDPSAKKCGKCEDEDERKTSDKLSIWMFPNLIVDNQYAHLLVPHATKIAEIHSYSYCYSGNPNKKAYSIVASAYSFSLMKKMLTDRKGMCAVPTIIRIIDNETHDEGGVNHQLLRTEESQEFVSFLTSSPHLFQFLGRGERELIVNQYIEKTWWKHPELDEMDKTIVALDSQKSSESSQNSQAVAANIAKLRRLYFLTARKVHLEKVRVLVDNGFFDDDEDAALKLLSLGKNHSYHGDDSKNCETQSNCTEFLAALRTLMETLVRRNPSLFTRRRLKELFVSVVARKCLHQNSISSSTANNPLHQFVLGLGLKPKPLELFKKLADISNQILQLSKEENETYRIQGSSTLPLREKFAELSGYAYPTSFYDDHLSRPFIP